MSRVLVLVQASPLRRHHYSVKEQHEEDNTAKRARRFGRRLDDLLAHRTIRGTGGCSRGLLAQPSNYTDPTTATPTTTTTTSTFDGAAINQLTKHHQYPPPLPLTHPHTTAPGIAHHPGTPVVSSCSSSCFSSYNTSNNVSVIPGRTVMAASSSFSNTAAQPSGGSQVVPHPRNRRSHDEDDLFLSPNADAQTPTSVTRAGGSVTTVVSSTPSLDTTTHFPLLASSSPPHFSSSFKKPKMCRTSAASLEFVAEAFGGGHGRFDTIFDMAAASCFCMACCKAHQLDHNHRRLLYRLPKSSPSRRGGGGHHDAVSLDHVVNTNTIRPLLDSMSRNSAHIDGHSCVPYSWTYIPLRFPSAHRHYRYGPHNAPQSPADVWTDVEKSFLHPVVQSRGTHADHTVGCWDVSYHGTCWQALANILAHEPRQLRGTDEHQIRSRSHHVSHQLRNDARRRGCFYFTTPSIKYAAMVAYATPFQSQSGAWWQGVLEVRVRPGSYRRIAQTLLQGHYEIDPCVPNHQIGWKIRDSKQHATNYLTALLVRRLSDEPYRICRSPTVSTKTLASFFLGSFARDRRALSAEDLITDDGSPAHFGVLSGRKVHQLQWWQPWNGAPHAPAESQEEVDDCKTRRRHSWSGVNYRDRCGCATCRQKERDPATGL